MKHCGGLIDKINSCGCQHPLCLAYARSPYSELAFLLSFADLFENLEHHLAMFISLLKYNIPLASCSLHQER